MFICARVYYNTHPGISRRKGWGLICQCLRVSQHVVYYNCVCQWVVWASQEFSHRKDVLTGRLPGPPTNPFNHNRADEHCQDWSWLPNGKSAAPALLPVNQFFQLAADWTLYETFFKKKLRCWEGQKSFCIRKQWIRVYVCILKTTEFEWTEVTSQIWAYVYKHLGRW